MYVCMYVCINIYIYRSPSLHSQQGCLERLRFQRDAVRAPSGAHLVVAGAGSGKTKTLTERLAYLVREVGVEPQKCLGCSSN